MKNNDFTKKYNRILLKYSGEAFMGQAAFGIESDMLHKITHEIASLVEMGVQVGLVVGGGNLFRGKSLSEGGLNRITADHMGMLATVMNALALRDAFKKSDIPACVMSAIPMTGLVDAYDSGRALAHLASGKVVIFAAGTGNPLFTTDTAACLRAVEIEADIVLKATKVDGIYSADPLKHKDASRYSYLTYQDVLTQGLQVMDATAICLCQEHNMPLQVFDMSVPGALVKIIAGERVGTIVGAERHDE